MKTQKGYTQIRLSYEVRFIKVYFTECQLIFHFPILTYVAVIIIKGEPVIVRGHLRKVPMASVCISSITQAELLRGVARKPEAKHLPLAGQRVFNSR